MDIIQIIDYLFYSYFTIEYTKLGIPSRFERQWHFFLVVLLLVGSAIFLSNTFLSDPMRVVKSGHCLSISIYILPNIEGDTTTSYCFYKGLEMFMTSLA